MNVAQICFNYEPFIGGVEKVVKEISERLAARGNTVQVFCTGSEMARFPELLKRFKKNCVTVNVVRNRNLLMHLLCGRFDVFHIHSFPAPHAVIGLLVGKIRGIPVVLQGHYSPEDVDINLKYGSFSYRMLDRPLLATVGRYIAVVKSEQEKIAQVCPIPLSRMSIIPNGVNVKELTSISAVPLRDTDTTHLLFVGRVAYVKGIDVLIDSFNRLVHRTKKKFDLTIVGPIQEPAYFAKLQVLAREQKDKIYFKQVGRMDVIKEFYSCDIFVLPTRGEVFGIVLAEAMFCKKIVVGSKCGGIPEVIEDGKTGFLFTSEDPESLSSVILNITERDKQELEAIRNKAFEKASLEYNWDKSADSVENIYRELIAK